MRDGANLIIFTTRKGCSSPEEMKIFNYIIQERFTEEVRKHFALVITACEGTGFSKRNKFIERMRVTTQDTRNLFNYAMNGRIKMVSFPDVDKVEDQSIKSIFQRKIEASEEELRELLKECTTQLHFKETFRDIDKRNWYLLPTQYVNPNCIQS